MKNLIKVFGVALDPNDNRSKLLIKYNYIQALQDNKIKQPNYLDPYDYLVAHSIYLKEIQFQKIGKFLVESWLRPKPNAEDLDFINPTDYKIFLESNGCLEYRQDLEKYLEKNINDELPLMIGVDHSSTGAFLSFLSKKHGKENVSCIILDGHFDAIPSNIRIGLAKYAADNNIETSNVLLNSEDINKMQDIKDYYNCGTFLKYIIEENIIDPSNIFVIGFYDYPNDYLKNVDDDKVKKFVQEFEKYEKMGVNLLPKIEDFSKFKTDLQDLMEKINTKQVVISTDVDVGAGKSVLAARFIDAFGFNYQEMLQIFGIISKSIKKNNIKLIGIDFTEIETFFLGKTLKDGTKDRTLDLFDEFLDRFLK